MALEQYQCKILPNRLYKVRKWNDLVANIQVEPNIMVNGKVNIYGLNSEEIPTQINEMYLPVVNRNITGLIAFEIIPQYIYCQGEAEDIILSGVQIVNDYGSFEG